MSCYHTSDSLRLHITSDKFILEPTDSKASELLVIDRVSQEISLEVNQGQIPAAAITKPIFGVVGIIRLVAGLASEARGLHLGQYYVYSYFMIGRNLHNLSPLQGPYLIVITKREKVGEINGQTIWRLTDFEMHSYKRTMLHLTEQQSSHNRTYMSMVDLVLRTDNFYFSTTFDLTHSLQRLHNTSSDFAALALHERADQRFVWNGPVLRELAQQPELGQYCLPLVHGFISISSATVNNKSFDYILVSRRCIYRAGTRFYVRGVDPEGQVANFVETEQIVQYDGIRCSYIQTRGSIPLFWSQKPNLKRMPLPVISANLNHMDSFHRHFDDQIYNYGKQVLVNLVNHKGYEKNMEQAFAETVQNAKKSDIRYESFDFHKECSKMRWDRLSLLTDKLASERREFGYFMVGKDGSVISQQQGVFRTNCMDCLDRTNVVQSMLGRDTLVEQLQRLGVLDQNSRIQDKSQFDIHFKNVWADNADTLSKQYAGTGALKTDFTRTGQRTKMGLVMDGWNSLIRYFKNNFQDGFRQDAIDLFLGNYLVEESEGITTPSPLKVERDWKFYAIPVIFLVAMAMFVISVLLPDEHYSETVMYILFWGAASGIALAVMFRYGNEYVDHPRLAYKTKTE